MSEPTGPVSETEGTGVPPSAPGEAGKPGAEADPAAGAAQAEPEPRGEDKAGELGEEAWEIVDETQPGRATIITGVPQTPSPRPSA